MTTIPDGGDFPFTFEDITLTPAGEEYMRQQTEAQQAATGVTVMLNDTDPMTGETTISYIDAGGAEVGRAGELVLVEDAKPFGIVAPGRWSSVRVYDSREEAAEVGKQLEEQVNAQMLARRLEKLRTADKRQQLDETMAGLAERIGASLPAAE
jgi:hypothetical protein